MSDTKRNLLEDVMAYLRSYVVMSEQQELVVALWTMHTHVIDHIEQTPYLSITSPDPECGKSRLLDSLKYLCARPWYMARPSEAVLYRHIDEVTPTLLIDEIDTVFGPQTARFHEGLRAVLDLGHRRGAMIPRSAEFGRKVEHFSPFCPKAFAGIGMLPETVSRRSLYIRLERRMPDEPIERFIERDVKRRGEPLRERIAAWADKRGEQIGQSRPVMPRDLSDRMIEGCEPLVAIAARFRYADEAREALVTLLTGDRLDDAETVRLQLLRDMKSIWDKWEEERERKLGRKRRRVRGIHTQDLIAELCTIEEAKWASYYGHDAIEPHTLASLLRHYGVRPVDVKLQKVVRKGYRQEDLSPIWQRYLNHDGSNHR